MAGLGDRMFEPPTADADKVEVRLAQLAPQLREQIRYAGDALAVGDLATAQRVLSSALSMAPNQPDVLRLYGLVLTQVGDHQAAAASFEMALRGAPDDAVTFCQYARSREDAGDLDAAIDLRRRAIERSPRSPLAWLDLGEHLSVYVGAEAAIAPLERAVQLAPGYAPGLLKLANAYVACGRAEKGAHMIRQALDLDPSYGAAWTALVDIKTVPLAEAELVRMREMLAGAQLDPAEQIAVRFALAAACERAGKLADSWHLLLEANARRKREQAPWDVERFREQEQQADEVFSLPHAQAPDPKLGDEVVFIMGLPRSGTTLVEQILASHPDTEGAGELAALPQVLTEESERRQQRYPSWVPAASADDWQRLGRRYLDITQQFRGRCSHSTDKLPSNWRALGAIRAMLPGARVVVCRRDPLENCWSCFKQYFPDGWEFTSDLEHLGLFWKSFDHAAKQWAERAPERVREQVYEVLTEHPDAEIRALLNFCGLPFDEVCLRPHELRRGVRTLSAAQVREPVHRHRTIAADYGALLDPLRKALGLAPWADKLRSSGASG